MLNQYEIEDKTAVGGSGGGVEHEDDSLDKAAAAAASRAAVLKSLAKTVHVKNPQSHKNQVVKTRQKILKGGANYTSKIVSSFKGAGGSSALPLMTSALVKVVLTLSAVVHTQLKTQNKNTKRMLHKTQGPSRAPSKHSCFVLNVSDLFLNK